MIRMVTMINPALIEKIPPQLREHRQWVNWRLVNRDGKATKIPCQPDGSAASSTDFETWCGFDDLDLAKHIGFVFSADDPFIGIDLDGCMEPEQKKLDAWASEVVRRFGTYAEVSPSGTGVKMFGITENFWTHKNKIELPGDGHGGKRPGIEIYDRGRYFAVTGRRMVGCENLVNVDEALEWLVEKFGMKHAEPVIAAPPTLTIDTPVLERAAKYLAMMEPSISGQRGHDACFKAACALVQGFDLSTDEAYKLLAVDFNPRCQPPWSERELQHKVSQAGKQPGQRGYLRDAIPQHWSKIRVRPTGPCEPMPEEPPEEPGVRRTFLHDASIAYLDQVLKGQGQLITTGIPELDYAIGGGVAPGEMVIVAARPSHGKSAIALQMVHHMTEAGIPAVVVSEEMSALAIGKRTIQFATDVPESAWKDRSAEALQHLSVHFGKRAKCLIIESCGTVDRVVSEVEKAAEEIEAGVVAIDYVQLLGSKKQNQYEQVTYASQEMRKLASRLGVVVIVLAQLNRQIEGRQRFVPTNADLKQTGQLEQDADVIVFGVWPHRIDATKDAKEYQFFVSKNRNRAINKSAFSVVFEPARQRLIADDEASSTRFASDFSEFGGNWDG